MAPADLRFDLGAGEGLTLTLLADGSLVVRRRRSDAVHPARADGRASDEARPGTRHVAYELRGPGHRLTRGEVGSRTSYF